MALILAYTEPEAELRGTDPYQLIHPYGSILMDFQVVTVEEVRRIADPLLEIHQELRDWLASFELADGFRPGYKRLIPKGSLPELKMDRGFELKGYRIPWWDFRALLEYMFTVSSVPQDPSEDPRYRWILEIKESQNG